MAKNKKEKDIKEKECNCEHDCGCGCESGCNCNIEDECACNCENEKVLEEKYIRLQAEFANFRVRTATEVQNMLKYEGASLILEILGVVDNFERAIKMDDNDLSDEVSNFLSGFKMIYTNLIDVLEKLEVKEIAVEGKEFDPTVSEAVITEHNEEKPENVVLEVMQKGYMYHDRVIRPAMVKVNK